MILRDCKWVDEAEPEPEKAPKKKRRVTDAMIAANRKNATMSTGPKAESLKKTRFNGTRHGMCSREIMFLEGEDQEAFWAEVDLWCAERGVKTSDERICVINAVYSVWVKTRVINAQAFAVSEAVDTINHTFANQKVGEVRDLLENLKEKPETTIAEVLNYSYGCSLLIAEFTALSERLEKHYCVEVSQREHALRLGGHRPKEVFTNKIVQEFNRAYFGSINGPGGFTAAQLANALMHDRPDDVSEWEFERRLEKLFENVPTIEEGHAECKRYVQRWIAQLTDRKELMEYREQKQKKAAIGQAPADVSASGQVLVRYFHQSERTYNSALRMVLSLKADRRKSGEEEAAEAVEREAGSEERAAGAEIRDESAAGNEAAGDCGHEADPAPEGVSAGVEIAPETAAIPAVEVQKPSEAVRTQVVGQPVANNVDRPAPVGTNGPLVQLSEEDVAAVRAQYRESFVNTQRKLNEWLGNPDS